jgi:ketosteroid isomerase-like protein
MENSSDVKNIAEDVIQAYIQAFNNRDVDAILSLYEHSDDTVLYDVSIPRERRGMNAIEDEWLQWSNMPYSFVMTAEELVSDVDGALAYARVLFRTDRTHKDGTKGFSRYRATYVLKHGIAGWKIIHEHLSMPIDLATLIADTTSNS